ncbi:MAG: hypothetical protein IQL11_00310 [Bacteroidales bacterium]|nr:hypothetical protein [Bacteroidales bacterium]
MKGSFQLIVTFVTFLLSATSCYYDNEEALYPSLNTACDTTNVTFSGKIVPMLANNCLSCHSNATAATSGNGIRLEDFADVRSQAAAISGAINHTGTYSPMPKNGSKLKPCLITQFEIWFKNGTPNN